MFYLNRCEIKSEPDGTQSLAVKDLKLADQGQYECKIGDRSTAAKLTVEEGNKCTCLVKEDSLSVAKVKLTTAHFKLNTGNKSISLVKEDSPSVAKV